MDTLIVFNSITRVLTDAVSVAIHGLKLLAYLLADNNNAISRCRINALEQNRFWSPSTLLSNENVRLHWNA